MKRALLAITLCLPLAGCGELSNTIRPDQGTANRLTVALYGPALDQLGIEEAVTRGYFTQADLDVQFVHVTSTAAGVSMLEHNLVQLAILNEPSVLLARNSDHPVVSVAAIVQSPSLPTTKCRTTHKSKHKSVTHCRATTVHPLAAYSKAGTYDGLVLALMENTIVNHTAPSRLFVQAVARGYDALRANPPRTAGVSEALREWFSPGGQWGLQATTAWNAFGTYLMNHHVISNQNATPAASTNELLAGQGV
jgi:hypothetical protein